jgi:hypothetical protein
MVVKNLIQHLSTILLVLYIPQWKHGSKIGMRQTTFEKEVSCKGLETGILELKLSFLDSLPNMSPNWITRFRE